MRFTLDAGPFKDVYTLAYDWAADGLSVSGSSSRARCRRRRRASTCSTPEGDKTKVTYTLSVQLAVPMIGLFRRKAEKMIMDIALKELKRRVEGH